MSRPRISSELQEAADLLGAIRDDVRQRSGVAGGRGARLQRALGQMCDRGRFRGAAIAGEDGLPLAVHGMPFRIEAIGAAASILGKALDSLVKITGRDDLPAISVEVGFDAKVVVRPVRDGDILYYLMVMCPVKTDERAEVELSIGHLTTIVGRE